MSLNASEIAALAVELGPLVGSRVDELRVPAERAVAMELRGPAGPATLFLSAEADLTRVHASRARFSAPERPYPFQAVLRRELEGGRLSGLEPLPGDRVIEIAFERGPAKRWLVAELTGRHGNVFLLDEARVILASAHRNLSSRRQLLPGRPYSPPAPRPEASREPVRFQPVAGAPFPLSAAVEEAYAPRERERALLEARRRLRDPVRAAVARLGRAQVRLEEEAARVPAADADRRRADLLKSSLHLLRRGMREVVLTEYTEEGPRQVRMALDPSVSPRANMERAYRQYRRIVESASRVAERQSEVRERLSGLSALLAEIEAATLADLPRLEREARRLGAGPRPAAAPRKKRRPEAPPPYRSFRSLGGGPLLVGRGAAENDLLTFRIARGNDLWLHVRGRSGAHVIARVEKGKGPDQDTLLDAAHLAGHFSDARGESPVEVAYTRVKYVRKPRGAAPGAVTYSQERTLLLRVEAQRMERLLAGEETPEP